MELLSIFLFLDFSGGEFLLIAVVFLMFFGSKSIPGMARTLGKAVRDFKEAANTVQREIQESTSIEEVKETKQASPDTVNAPLKAMPPPATVSQEVDLTTPSKPDPNTNSEDTKAPGIS